MRKYRGPVAVFDLKVGQNNLSIAGKILGEWFEAKGVPFYIVQVKSYDVENGVLEKFTVCRPKTNELMQKSELEMIEWINKLGERGD